MSEGPQRIAEGRGTQKALVSRELQCGRAAVRHSAARNARARRQLKGRSRLDRVWRGVQEILGRR